MCTSSKKTEITEGHQTTTLSQTSTNLTDNGQRTSQLLIIPLSVWVASMRTGADRAQTQAPEGMALDQGQEHDIRFTRLPNLVRESNMDMMNDLLI